MVAGDCSADGSVMITVGNDGMVVLMRDLQSNSPTEQIVAGEGSTLNPHQSSNVEGCMISPDGSSAFTFCELGSLVKWKGLDSNQITATFIAGEGCPLDPHRSFDNYRGSISKNGKCGLTFGYERDEGVYWKGLDTDSPTPVPLCESLQERQMEEEDSMVYGCQLSPDGRWALVVGDCDGHGFMDIWRGLESGNIQRTTVLNSPSQEYVMDCLISLDGSWALTVDIKGNLIQWRNLESDTPTSTHIPIPSIPSRAEAKLKLSLDGSWALVQFEDKNQSVIVHHLNEVPVVTIFPIPIVLITGNLFGAFHNYLWDKPDNSRRFTEAKSRKPRSETHSHYEGSETFSK